MDPPGCTQPCGGGTIEWRRHVEVSQAYGGTCNGGLSKREACNTHVCPVNCVGSWHTIRVWNEGSCSLRKKCTEKEYKRTVEKKGNGVDCPTPPGQKSKQCVNASKSCGH
eukprot:7017169-Prymnesium_polylepis.1